MKSNNTSDSIPKRRSSKKNTIRSDVQRNETMLKAGALQTAILNSENISSIATDANGVIQMFAPRKCRATLPPM